MSHFKQSIVEKFSVPVLLIGTVYIASISPIIPQTDTLQHRDVSTSAGHGNGAWVPLKKLSI